MNFNLLCYIHVSVAVCQAPVVEDAERNDFPTPCAGLTCHHMYVLLLALYSFSRRWFFLLLCLDELSSNSYETVSILLHHGRQYESVVLMLSTVKLNVSEKAVGLCFVYRLVSVDLKPCNLHMESPCILEPVLAFSQHLYTLGPAAQTALKQ